jgi:hypothetical protein
MDKRPKIYIASKATWAQRWRDLRADGFRIVSSWIDQAEPGSTHDWDDLWAACISEAAECDIFILFREQGEAHSGTLVELGAALTGKAIIATVNLNSDFKINNYTRAIKKARDFAEALDYALEEWNRAPFAPEPEPLVVDWDAIAEPVKKYDPARLKPAKSSTTYAHPGDYEMTWEVSGRFNYHEPIPENVFKFVLSEVEVSVMLECRAIVAEAQSVVDGVVSGEREKDFKAAKAKLIAGLVADKVST